MKKNPAARAVSADDIYELLRLRHSKDVFVGECKNGSTWFQNLLRLDAWAMARSWAHPRLSGYEIKVARGDWLRDSKLQNYLPLCNCLWVVAPTGIVQAEELPEGVGLLIVNGKGSGLLTKRKAVHREIEEPSGLFRYLLMCRTRVVDLRDSESEDRATLFREYTEGRRSSKEVGFLVSQRLREETIVRLAEAAGRVAAAESKLAQMALAEQTLKDLGFGEGIPGDWSIKKRVVDGERVQLGVLLRESINDLDRGQRQLEEALEKLNGKP